MKEQEGRGAVMSIHPYLGAARRRNHAIDAVAIHLEVTPRLGLTVRVYVLVRSEVPPSALEFLELVRNEIEFVLAPYRARDPVPWTRIDEDGSDARRASLYVPYLRCQGEDCTEVLDVLVLEAARAALQRYALKEGILARILLTGTHGHSRMNTWRVRRLSRLL